MARGLAHREPGTMHEHDLLGAMGPDLATSVWFGSVLGSFVVRRRLGGRVGMDGC